MRPEVKALRDRISSDMDYRLELHSPEWDYAKDVISYIDDIERFGWAFILLPKGKTLK